MPQPDGRGISKSAAAKLFAEQSPNLVNDPYHVSAWLTGSNTDLVITAADGASSYSVVPGGDPNYPVATPALKRVYGSGTGVLGRSFLFSDLGVKVGDVINIVVVAYVPIGQQIVPGAFFRNAANGVVGSITSPSSQIGPGLKVMIWSGITVPSASSPPVKVEIRFSAASATAGADGETYLAWGIYKRTPGQTTDNTQLYTADLMAGLIPDAPRRLNVGSRMYALAGGTGTPTAIQEMNAYLDNFLQEQEGDALEIASSYGIQYENTYRLQPGNTALDPNTNGGSSFYNITSGSYGATFRLKDAAKYTLLTASPTVYVATTATTTRRGLLCIGDSWTRLNTIGAHVKAALPGTIDVVGTRTFDSGAHLGQGHGGWLSYTFYTQVGSSGATACDSFLLFPTGVAGNRYHYNTAFWAAVVGGSPGYDQDGFQYAATDFSGGANIYNASGYLSSPTSGDTCYDPTQSAGAQLRQYNGSSWVSMPSSSATGTSIGVTAPSTFTRASGSFLTDGCAAGLKVYMSGFSNSANNGLFTISSVTATTLVVTSTSLVTETASASKFYTLFKVDVAKYYAKNANAFKQTGSFVAPKFYSILLGTNDFFSPTTIDSASSWTNYVLAIDAIIASIKAYDSAAVILLCTPGVPPVAAKRNRDNLMEAIGRIIRRYDTAANAALSIFVVQTHLAIDPDRSWPTETLPVNLYSAVTAEIATDYVHPNEDGYDQAGDHLAATVQYLR